MSKAPLAEALVRYADCCVARYHVPGHKGRNVKRLDGSTQPESRRYDVTELPGLDDLAAPSDSILELENRLSAVYGARRSFLSVQGSTLGLQAAVLALCKEGDTVIVPRNVHRSVISGLILSGAIPYYIKPDIDPDTNIAFGPSVEAYKAALSKAENVKAALITNPNYYGICPDLTQILSVCKAANVRSIVDEAHGSHLRFMPSGPPDGVTLGADIVVQSPHKTLLSLTQSAWIHVCAEDDIACRVKQCLVLLQTSSPSYLLLASLEDSILALEASGAEVLSDIREMTEVIRERAAEWGYIFPISRYVNDGLRCYIAAGNGSLSGKALYRHLMDMGVIPELYDDCGVLLMMGMGSSIQDVDRLLDCLEKISASGIMDKSFGAKTIEALTAGNIAEGYPAALPRRAALGETEQVPLSESAGRIAAELVAPSPPSIALIAPGDIIDNETIQLLQKLIDNETVIHGLTDVTLRTIKVIV